MTTLKNFTKQIIIYLGELLIILSITNTVVQSQESPAFLQPSLGLKYVNLFNGDFNYSLPLMEVPSPEGNFPLIINYHAGIQLNQAASSVGLGWSVSPGAISRQVIGYPDDYCEEIDWHKELDDDYVEGTVLVEEENFGFEKTYAHSGYGLIKWSNNPHIDLIGHTFISSIPVVGNVYNYLNYKPAAKEAWQMSFNATNNIHNNISYDHTIKNKLHYLRAIIDIDTYIIPYGALYLGKHTGDSYSGLNHECKTDMDMVVDLNLKNSFRPIGLPYIAYDKYMVTVPGISGNIYPYLMENGSLVGVTGPYNVYTEPNSEAFMFLEYEENNNPFFPKESKAFFRYIGEPASNVQMHTGYLTFDGSYWQNDPPNVIVQNENFYDTPEHNENNGFFNNFGRRRLLSKRRVDWFIYEEVVEVEVNEYSSTGIVMNVDLFGGSPNMMHRDNIIYNYNRSYRQIYAFRIITEDGTTFHFGQPVFAYDEYMESISIDEPGAKVKRHRKSAYPYTWLLTAITGPDYVDVNENGFTDDEDYGYWISFDYDHYYDYANNDLDYYWRAPYESGQYFRDITNKNKYFSSGKIQLYYLNKIKTRTHTAILIYNNRLDACDKNGKRPLSLNEIRIFHNEDLLSLETLGFTPSGFSHSNGLDNFYDLDDVYSVSESLLNSIINSSLKSVKFWYNYDLCRYSPDSEAPNKGKLTLKKIDIYGRKDRKISQPFAFDYNEDNTADNPIYWAEKFDRWGFYKSDGTGDDRYVTETSKDLTDAWSLRKIITPLGAQLEIIYESDDYIKTGLGEIVVDLKSKNQFRFKENYSGFIRNDGKNMENYFSAGTQIPITFYIKEWVDETVQISEEPKSPTIQSVNGDIIDFGTNLYNPEDFYYNNENDFKILAGYEVNYSSEYPLDGNVYGGGIRVKELKFTDENNLNYKQVFQYSNNEGVSCGITPTEPPSFNKFGDIFLDFIGDSDPTSETIDGLGPGVQYSKVIVKNYGVIMILKQKQNIILRLITEIHIY